MRIGYLPFSSNLQHPADRRRFVSFANKFDIKFEVYNSLNRYDIIVLSQACDPTHWCSNNSEAKLIYDCADSYALLKPSTANYARGIAKYVFRQHKNIVVPHSKAILKLAEAVDCVVVTTNAMKDVVSGRNQNVFKILDNFEEVNGIRKNSFELNRPIRIAWEGVGGTLFQVGLIKNALNHLAVTHDIELWIVTDRKYNAFLGTYFERDSEEQSMTYFKNVRFFDWSIENLKNLVNADIGIIPIDLNNELTAGKPANKLLLFWQLGLPTITSNTSEYRMAMAETGYEFTCVNEADWVDNLTKVIKSRDLRSNISAATKGIAELQRQRNFEQWKEVFKRLGYTSFSK